jgi:ectoine hydrolase
MRSAARIVELMHARIYEIIEPGLAKNELAAEIFHTGIRGKDEHWGDYPAIMPMLPTGLDATAAHLTWDNSKLKPGDITFFEIAGCHKRYHCPLSRTISLGTPPQKYLDAEAAVLDAMHAGLENAKPGNTCEDIAIAFFDRLETHGFKKDSRTGYSIGLSYPPDWGERTISLRRGDTTELQENMTFHFMPALWLDDGGLEITESVVITETGYQSLATVPQKLLVK